MTYSHPVVGYGMSSGIRFDFLDIVIVLCASLYQCCLRPGPCKVKQTLSLIFNFSAGSGKSRLFGVLPELICFRYGHTAQCVPTPFPTYLPKQ